MAQKIVIFFFLYIFLFILEWIGSYVWCIFSLNRAIIIILILIFIENNSRSEIFLFNK